MTADFHFLPPDLIFSQFLIFSLVFILSK